MRVVLAAFLVLVVTSSTTGASSDDDQPFYPFADKQFVIVKTTRDFAEADAIAHVASAKLALRLGRSPVFPEAQHGLTFSKADCDAAGFDFPCYVPRGRWDDGEYVSIEWSSAYESFTRGYYVVIVSSGSRADRFGKASVRQGPCSPMLT
jgi:hypothetical protein